LTAARLVLVGLTYVATAVGWGALGASIVGRTGETDARLRQEVAHLWGGRHEQLAPDAWWQRPRTATEEIQERNPKGELVTRQVKKTVLDDVPLALESQSVDVDLDLDQRRKGLLWYNTYAVEFRGRYTVRNPDDTPRDVFVRFRFPSKEALYDAFVFRVDGKEDSSRQDFAAGVVRRVAVPARGEVAAEISFRSRGLGEWLYAFGEAGVTQVRDFTLTMTTDFAAIDFPPGTISPSSKTAEGEGHRLVWRFESLVTGQKIGLDPPRRLNPGPLAARITFFAPVALLFFFGVTVVLGLLRGTSLHPMNYVFLAAAFFSFHLLLAYLVDHMNVHAAFAIASATSVFLVISYLRLVVGLQFAVLEAGLAQFLFLVLFSYSFFFEGFTGITVTVGAVLTLFVLMQMTGRVDWNAAFRSSPATPAR
jgi:hypothetical protein